MNYDIDYYSVEFKSEEYVKDKLNVMVKYSRWMFQLLVNDDDDEEYIPKLKFEYDICDCSKTNLFNKDIWDKFIKSEKAIIFTNTSILFDQFKNFKYFGVTFTDGRQGFSQMFYSFYRDYMWSESQAKYIFLVSEENARAMYLSVNNGFSILLNPLYMRKKTNMKDQEKTFIKKFKKVD